MAPAAERAPVNLQTRSHSAVPRNLLSCCAPAAGLARRIREWGGRDSRQASCSTCAVPEDSARRVRMPWHSHGREWHRGGPARSALLPIADRWPLPPSRARSGGRNCGRRALWTARRSAAPRVRAPRAQTAAQPPWLHVDRFSPPDRRVRGMRRAPPRAVSPPAPGTSKSPAAAGRSLSGSRSADLGRPAAPRLDRVNRGARIERSLR
jgi:hypothetical protein